MKWRSFILVDNEKRIMLWSGNLKEQNCFGDWGRDLRVKLIWTLKYRLCEIMFPHCRVRWWSVVTRGLNCCSVREGIAWLCDSWGVKTGCGLWNYPELITSNSVKCKGKTRIQMKGCYKSQFSWQLSSRKLQTAFINIKIYSQIQLNYLINVYYLHCFVQR